MRIMINLSFPAEPFNTAVRKGTVGTTMKKILEGMKPEAVYFTEHNGLRGATIVVNVENSSDIPALAEPWFLKFNAECKFGIAMTPEDLQKSGLEELGKKWG